MSIKMQLAKGPTVEETFEKFIKSRRAKNLSHRTISFYQENHKMLTEFIDGKTTYIGVNLSLSFSKLK